MKVVIDTDPGTDDALAIAMALNSPDLDVLGLTTVGGNASLAHTTNNALALAEWLGRPDLPVSRGAFRPVRGAYSYAYHYHGPSGLTVRLPRPMGAAMPLKASDYLAYMAYTHPGELVIIALGPLTNVALALRRRPDLAPRIRSLVLMGGNARVPGNVTPAAEFNFWFDPEAAAEVLAAPIPRVVMFGLDITNHAPLHKTRFDRIVAVDTPLTRLMRHDMGARFAADPAATAYVWDCITAAWLIDSSIVTASERLPITVDTTFGPAYGATVVGPGGADAGRPVEVMLDLDVERFYALYSELLTRTVE